MDPTRRCDASAALGAVVWVAVVAVGGVGGSGGIGGVDLVPVDRIDLVTAAVLLAVLVLVPAALPLAATPRRDGTHARPFRWAVAAQPPAAALFAVSALVPHGPLAAGLALPWVGAALLLAWFGLWRLLPRGLAPAEETLLDAGLLYLPVGALAAVAYRLDLGFGYGLVIVHLTAAHYHYATFLLPVVAAALGRHMAGARASFRGERASDWRRSYRAAAVVLVAGVPLVAAGITASPQLEAVAGTVFAVAVAVVGLAFLRTALDVRRDDLPAAALLAVAGLSVAAAMVLAVAYAVGRWVGPPAIGVGEMIPTHGLLNAFGFALPAVLAWRRLDPPSRARPPGVPLGAHTARWRVGPDYAERAGLAGEPLAGQVDAIADYAGDRVDQNGFDPDALAPEVARFYQRTAEYRLTYRARWHRPFGIGAALASRVTRRIEQLNLPTDGAVHEAVGRCPALSGPDPRDAPRFWIRTDPDSGAGVFVSTYGVHERDGTAYMNIGLPLPGASLAAVLAPSNRGTGLELSSSAEPGGDAGLWLVVPRVGTLKLPVSERFRVRRADDPEAPAPPEDGDSERTAASDRTAAPERTVAYDLIATHEMWLFGRQFLTIRYGIARDAVEQPGVGCSTSA